MRIPKLKNLENGRGFEGYRLGGRLQAQHALDQSRKQLGLSRGVPSPLVHNGVAHPETRAPARGQMLVQAQMARNSNHLDSTGNRLGAKQ